MVLMRLQALSISLLKKQIIVNYQPICQVDHLAFLMADFLVMFLMWHRIICSPYQKPNLIVIVITPILTEQLFIIKPMSHLVRVAQMLLWDIRINHSVLMDFIPPFSLTNGNKPKHFSSHRPLIIHSD